MPYLNCCTPTIAFYLNKHFRKVRSIWMQLIKRANGIDVLTDSCTSRCDIQNTCKWFFGMQILIVDLGQWHSWLDTRTRSFLSRGLGRFFLLSNWMEGVATSATIKDPLRRRPTRRSSTSSRKTHMQILYWSRPSARLYT